MLYFIPWVVFLLVIILAVPITALMGREKVNKPIAEPEADGGMDEPLEDVAEEAAPMQDDNFNQSFEAPATGGGDFSAFDDEFK